MSSSNPRPQQDSRTGEYSTVDRNGNRRPADMQALPSRPRTINPTSHTGTSQLQSTAGINPSTTSQRAQSGVSLPSQARPVDRSTPAVNPTSLSSSYDSTGRNFPTLASQISQSPGNQWTPSAPPNVLPVQPTSPNYLPAVPTSSIRSTNAAPLPYAHPTGTPQSRNGVPTSTGRSSIQATPGPSGGNGGQATHGDAGGQLPRRNDLDSSYKVRDNRFFVRGRVLMTLWTEPMGTSASGRASSGGRSFNRDVYLVAHGEMAFSKVRRFVVIGVSDRFCTALAISTHGGTGARFMQQDQSQYGLVYTGGTPPETSDGERGMQTTAVKIDPDSMTTSLDPMSRIHYGAIYTVQHNIRVKAYGMVNRDSVGPLMNQFRQVNGQRLSFYPGPLQAPQAERPPPGITSGPSAAAQRPTGPHQLLPPQYQSAMERHAPTAAGPSTITQPSRNNAQNAARPPQSNAPSRATGPASNTRRPAAPPPSDETLRQRGYNEAQIRSIHEMIRLGATSQYAIAKTTALARLDCTPEAADRIAQAVQSGIPYEAVVAQYRAATEQQASGNNSDDD